MKPSNFIECLPTVKDLNDPESNTINNREVVKQCQEAFILAKSRSMHLELFNMDQKTRQQISLGLAGQKSVQIISYIKEVHFVTLQTTRK